MDGFLLKDGGGANTERDHNAEGGLVYITNMHHTDFTFSRIKRNLKLRLLCALMMRWSTFFYS